MSRARLWLLAELNERHKLIVELITANDDLEAHYQKAMADNERMTSLLTDAQKRKLHDSDSS
jgi:hypothetical protein